VIVYWALGTTRPSSVSSRKGYLLRAELVCLGYLLRERWVLASNANRQIRLAGEIMKGGPNSEGMTFTATREERIARYHSYSRVCLGVTAPAELTIAQLSRWEKMGLA
jgi:hypothetical protein